MPRIRRRIVFCDRLMCEAPNQVLSLSPDTSDWGKGEAAARQEPPPKALVLVATGLREPLVGCPHFDGIARDGSTSLLAVRQDTFEGGSLGEQGVRCMAQIMGIHKAVSQPPDNEDLESCADMNLGGRFMGMLGCVASNCAEVIHLGERMGLHSLGQLDTSLKLQSLPSAVVNYLGIDDETASDTDQDIAFVHIDASQPFPDGWDDGEKLDVKSREPRSYEEKWLTWMDSFARALDGRKEFFEGVLFSIIVDGGYEPGRNLRAGGGSVVVGDEVSGNSTDGFEFSQILRPKQSFEFKGTVGVQVSLENPLVMIQRLRGVVRKDEQECFTPPSGGSGILAEHLLVEISYKLARSKKYGA